MRFLILTQYYPPEIGAPQTRLSAMAQHLVSRGHSVEVVTAMPNYPQGRIFKEYRRKLYVKEQVQGIPVHRSWLYAGMGSGLRRIINYVTFSVTCGLGLLRCQKPDYVFVESPPLLLTVPGVLAATLSGASCIFFVADLWPDSILQLDVMRDGLFIRLAAKLESWAYKHCDYVTAVTEEIREILLTRKLVTPSKVLFLPNGVDLEHFRFQTVDCELREELGLAGKRIVLYQGTQGYAHGLESVMRTAEILRCDTDIHFLFVGSGSERPHMERLKTDLKLTNVSFHDPVPVTELKRYFSICECGLVSLKDNPDFRGARPAKVNPILGAGKPIVFFGQGEGADIVAKARAGIVVPYGDVAGLAEAIRLVARNPEVGAELGRNGRRYAEEHLSWPMVMRSWLDELGAERAAPVKVPASGLVGD